MGNINSNKFMEKNSIYNLLIESLLDVFGSRLKTIVLAF